jgi:hypothetical protein
MASVVVGVIGILAALASLGTSTASATPGNNGACTGCHSLQGGSLRVTTDTTTKSVTPGASFAVSISWTGGGGSRTEINWPNTASNTQFTPTQRVPYSGSSASGTVSSTLTAPVTAGTYTIRVYAAQSAPTMETDYKDMTITVVAPVTYTLTYTAGANGSITGTSPQTVASGASGTAVTATPAAGYHFVNWSDGSTANPRTDSTVTASISVTATFAINTYTITPNAGANGSISPATAVTVNSGASRVFTITPAAGYHVVSVLVDGSSVGAVTSYTFTNVTANRTISATFGANAVTTYTLTYTAGANGSITGTSPQTVASGASGTAVTATPAAGYHFVNWSDGSTANPRTDSTVTASISVTATFASDTHTLTPVAAANGSISPSGTITVTHAADQSFTITANSGYHIAGILVDGTPVATVQATMSGAPEIAVSTYTFTNVTASHTISATFAPHATTGSDTAGPLTSRLRLSAGRGDHDSVILNAVVDDTTTGGSNAVAAEYFLDAVGPIGSGTTLSASDGNYGTAREAVRATLRVAGLSSGGHTVHVRGRDAAGNWGATARLYFLVRTNRRMSDGEVRLVLPDDDSRNSSQTIVIWVGTGHQQKDDD